MKIVTFISPLLVLQTVSAFSASPRSITVKRSSSFQPTTSSLSFFNKKEVPEAEPVFTQGIGPEGCALPSPSGVNTLAEPIQAAIVVAIFAALGVSTIAFSSFLDTITLNYEWVQSWRYSWPLLGAIYAAAGVTHFTLEEEYENIFPSKGAWGFWYLPGSPEFHVKWTGVAEFLGGVGLLIGGAYDAFDPVWTTCPNIITDAGIGSDAAAGLLLLTIVVSPANIFMYTHGAKLPKDGPELPVAGHAVRGIMQVVLFGLLYQMGQGTFDAILH